MKTILVVDDEPTLVATLKYNLEREGYRVLAADDGEKGLSMARADRPDLIILDLMLPVIDGFEVCRILRREMTVPILMLTAKTDEVDKVVGLELGADDYVTKPFSMRELLARVKALLRRAETSPVVERRYPGCGRSSGRPPKTGSIQGRADAYPQTERVRTADLLAAQPWPRLHA